MRIQVHSILDITPITPVLLYTVTFNNNQNVVVDNQTGLFTVPSEGRLAIKIDSGSITKPHLYLIVKGAA